jgi:ankyrin repeat protein
LLLDLGFPAGARGPNGETALHQAAMDGHLAVVRELVERGAPLDARDDAYHARPAGWASYGLEHWPDRGEAGEVLGYLLDRSEDPFELAAPGRADRLGGLLATNPALARARDRLGRTPLHGVRDASPDATIETLAAGGADLRALDASGKTPLEVMEEEGWDEAAAALRRRLEEI